MSSQYTPHINRKHVKRGRGSAGSIQLISNGGDHDNDNNINGKENDNNGTLKNNFIVSKEDDDEDDNSIIDPMDMLDSLLEETVG